MSRFTVRDGSERQPDRVSVMASARSVIQEVNAVREETEALLRDAVQYRNGALARFTAAVGDAPHAVGSPVCEGVAIDPCYQRVWVPYIQRCGTPEDLAIVAHSHTLIIKLAIMGFSATERDNGGIYYQRPVSGDPASVAAEQRRIEQELASPYVTPYNGTSSTLA